MQGTGLGKQNVFVSHFDPPRPIRLLAQQFCTTGSWSGHAFSVVGGAGEPSSCLVIGTTRAQDAKAANKKGDRSNRTNKPSKGFFHLVPLARAGALRLPRVMIQLRRLDNNRDRQVLTYSRGPDTVLDRTPRGDVQEVRDLLPRQ